MYNHTQEVPISTLWKLVTTQHLGTFGLMLMPLGKVGKNLLNDKFLDALSHGNVF